MASIAKRASDFTVNALAKATGCAGAIAVITALILLLGGCTSHPATRTQTDIQAAEDACFSGSMKSYQKVGREERVSVVCK